MRPLNEPQPITLFLGLGSNLGDRKAHLRRALDLLAVQLTLENVSSLYETDPVGYLAQPRFLNAVCQATTRADPETVLSWAKEVEQTLSRRPAAHDGPRTADVDLLLYGSLVLDTPRLTLPHPRLAQRAFVLVPFSEIAPAVAHPVLQRSIQELLATVEGREGVRSVEGRSWWLRWTPKFGQVAK